MLSSLTVSQKISLVICGFLLLSGGTLAYLSWQKGKASEEVQASADNAVRQLNRLQLQVSRTVSETDVSQLKRAIPTEWQMDVFIADVSTAAKESNVNVAEVTPSESAGKQTKDDNAAQKQSGSTQAAGGNSSPPPEFVGVTAKEVAITVEGEDHNLSSFIDKLQRMPRFLWIKEYNVNFGQKTVSSQSGSRAALKVFIYANAPWDAGAPSAVTSGKTVTR